MMQDEATRAAAVRLVRVTAVIASISGLGWLAGTIANATGGPANLVDPEILSVFFAETPFGPPAMVRLGLLAVLLVLGLLRPAHIRSISAVGAALLTSQAWLGHAADGGGGVYGAIMMSVYAIHVLAASAWIGGLPVLLLMILATYRDGGSRRNLVGLLLRYSAIALGLVGLVVATGVANTAFHLRGASASLLWDSPYARILALKVGFVGLMLCLAAGNRLIIIPRLRSGDGGARLLAVSVRLEIGVAGIVLAAAALLGLTAPPG